MQTVSKLGSGIRAAEGVDCRPEVQTLDVAGSLWAGSIRLNAIFLCTV